MKERIWMGSNRYDIRLGVELTEVVPDNVSKEECSLKACQGMAD